MKNISVVIINYNTSSYTLKCIESVIKHTNKKLTYNIIVVDNNSETKDFNHLKTNFPLQGNISLHRSNINTGFGGGNMYGAQFADSKYILFLNNDAMLKNDCLSILFKYMENNKDVGVATAQNFDEKDKPVASFDHNKGIRKLLFGRSFLEKSDPLKYPKRKKIHTKPISVNYINGAFMFFKASAFAKVGGFDTNIFLYFEEMDICYRLKKIKFSSVLVPEAKITHYQGASTAMSQLISKEGFLSYMYVTKKNYSYSKHLIIKLYYFITLIVKPKKWFLLSVLLHGANISQSLKQKQQIKF